MAEAAVKLVDTLRLSNVLLPCVVAPSRTKIPRGSLVTPVNVIEVELTEVGLIQRLPVLFVVSKPSTTRYVEPLVSGVDHTLSGALAALKLDEVKIPTATCEVVVLGALLVVCAFALGRKSPKLRA